MFGIKRASLLVVVATLAASAMCQEAKKGPVLLALHRFYKAGNGDHFYTTDNRDGLKEELAKINYKYEGIAGRVFKSPQAGTLALHRYYNNKSGDHFYTTSWAELGGGKGNYKYEGIEGYLFPGPTPGAIPLYRYYNGGNGDHFYTTNFSELQGGKDGYKLEGIQGYVFP